MNPIDKGERGRPRSAMVKYENNPKPRGRTFVFCQGERELIVELLDKACMTNVSGNHSIQFYECITDLWDSINFVSKKGEPNTWFNRIKMVSYKRTMAYHLMSLLFGVSGCAVHVTDIIGEKNNIIEGFCDALRDIAEDYSHTPINIVWVCGDKDDEQRKQFRKCYELGDVVLNLSDLKKDPIGFLEKLNPTHYPNERIVNETIRLSD